MFYLFGYFVIVSNTEINRLPGITAIARVSISLEDSVATVNCRNGRAHARARSAAMYMSVHARNVSLIVRVSAAPDINAPR